MKKIIALFWLLIIFAEANAQTPVSGGIYSNTTWTLANSPYIVTDTVVVFPGVTLTIQPGVVVKFNISSMLEIRQASIIAEGTLSDSIFFTTNSVYLGPGAWRGISLINAVENVFDYCSFRYANSAIINHLTTSVDSLKISNSRFIQNVVGVDARDPYIDSCVFVLDTAGVWCTSGYVKNSLFSNNKVGVESIGHVLNCNIVSNRYGVSSNFEKIKNCNVQLNTLIGIQSWYGSDSIINCNISNNGTGISIESSGLQNIVRNVIDHNNIGIKTKSSSGSIYCNKISNSTLYDLYYNISTNSNIFINNDWGTTDSAIIASHIYDGYDNISLGLVTFMPIDTTQCYLTGCNLHVTAIITNATCSTCNNGSAIAYVVNGYAPYTYTWYTTPLQTTQTATGLAPGTYTLCVTDAIGCTACNHNIYVDSTNCTGFSASAHGMNATCSSCNDGKAWVNVMGGSAPYSYSWYTTPMQNSDTAIGLLPGTYGVCVSDQYGCVVCDSVVIATGSCSAHFDLYPDSIQLHQYYAVNMASGVPPLTYLWQWGDGTTSTGPYPTHTYANAGFYAVCLDITDSVGCTSHYCNSYYLQKSENSMVYITVIPGGSSGINDLADNNVFTLYPNPTPGLIHLSFAEAAADTRVDVLNSTGQLILSKHLSNQTQTTLDLSKCTRGLYLIKVGNSNGVMVKKVIRD